MTFRTPWLVAILFGTAAIVPACASSDSPNSPGTGGLGGGAGVGGSSGLAGAAGTGGNGTGGKGGAAGSSGTGGTAGTAGAGGASGTGGSGGTAGTAGVAGSSGTAGAAGTAGAGGAGGGSCLLAPAPTCNTLTMPAAATFVTGEVGPVPAVSGGGVVPPGTYYLVKQIITSGTPITKKIAVSGEGTCFTALEIATNLTEARYSGTVTYNGSTSTTDFTCPITLSVSPSYQVLAPVGGKAKYVTLAGGTDYREWLQE